METTRLANPTLEDVWRMFQETDRRFKETDRKFQESERRFREAERVLNEKSLETDRRFQETDRQLKETDRKIQETGRQIKETDRQLGRLGNRLGEFVEWTVLPAAVRLFRERGIEVHEVMRPIRLQRGDEGLEIDILASNDVEVVAIECKSALSSDDVNEHVARLGKVKRLLPKLGALRVHGAVAAMVLPDAAARYAYRQGLFVIAQSGDQLVIRNDPAFRPRVW